MRHRWELLTFLHWSYPAPTVQALLPPELRVETFDGRAWVALVPFFMRVAAPVGASVPWASRFCETNVRTYVRDARGRTGVWFLSLDASRLGAVAVARSAFRLPYFWSRMDLRADDGGALTYTCRRRGPGRAHPRSLVSVAVTDPFRPDDLGALDHFLTARWRLFSVEGDRRRVAEAEHAPWPLFRAEVRALDDELVAAAGLPAPAGAPLVHYSPGVDVRIGAGHPF
jgi:uncharacterized protein YqjF (DUF2071 family)